MNNFYEFRQNNSGGYFDVNDNVSVLVIIEAETPQQALDKFDELIKNASGSCPCCGDRWNYILEDVESIELKDNQTIEQYADTALYESYKHSPRVILHYLNGEKRKFYHHQDINYKES